MPSPGDQPDFRNTTVDGHRAFLEADPTSAALAVFDVPGLRVDVDAEGADVVARAAVVDVYRGVTILGSPPVDLVGPPDTADWTDRPLR